MTLKVEFQRFTGAADAQDAIASGAIDMGPFGTAPLLAAWQKAKDKPEQIFAVSGMTIVAARAAQQSAGRAVDRRSQAGRPDRDADADLAANVSVGNAIGKNLQPIRPAARAKSSRYRMPTRSATLVEGTGQVRPISPRRPSPQLALRDAKVHAVLNSSDVMNGKSSFLIMGATKAYIDAQPQMPERDREGDG